MSEREKELVEKKKRERVRESGRGKENPILTHPCPGRVKARDGESVSREIARKGEGGEQPFLPAATAVANE